MAGILYLVSTPIGNLGDITPRAARTLSEADFIAAEDTRVTLRLLNHLGIQKQLFSYHEHNSRESGERILARLLSGESCALTTDAGTPAISDPGGALVALCARSGVTVIPVPGPCALISALSVSGLESQRFCFEGFLSTAKKSRFEHLESLKAERRTMVFYEAPHKLTATLRDLLEAFGDREISISRELTKLHEETLRTTLSEALRRFSETPPRGEFVLVVKGADPPDEGSAVSGEEALALVEEYIGAGSSLKDAVRLAAPVCGFGKNELYSLAVRKRDKGRTVS